MRSDRSLALALLPAAFVLGQALEVSSGFLDPTALFWLSVAFGLCTAGLLVPSLPGLSWLGSWPVVVTVGLVLQFGELLLESPGVHIQSQALGSWDLFYCGLVAAAVLALSAICGRPWLGRAHFPLLLALHFLLGAWLIHASPRPRIDVWVMQQEASAELLRGRNPYGMTHRDIYSRDPGARTSYGYTYPPLTLLLDVPGYALGGDHRYSQLAALTLSGALLGYARPGPLGVAAAAVLLFTPRVFFVLEQGWTEPFGVMLLAAVVFCGCRQVRALGALLGLMFVSKQTLLPCVPLVLLLIPPPFSWRKVCLLLGPAALAGALVTVPFVLWGPAPIFSDLVLFHASRPVRLDSLSYRAWLATARGIQLPDFVAFLGAALAICAALRRAPRTPAGFAASMGFVSFTFFGLARQAFCNYYFFILGALCAAIAVADRGAE